MNTEQEADHMQIVADVCCVPLHIARRALLDAGGSQHAAITRLSTREAYSANVTFAPPSPRATDVGPPSTLEDHEQRILQQEVPPEFLCPITYCVMIDPVVCADGHSYERSAIERWLDTKSTSPMTNRFLRVRGGAPAPSLLDKN